MVNKKIIESELKKARSELFMTNNLKQMKFIQRKIEYLQSKMKRGI